MSDPDLPSDADGGEDGERRIVVLVVRTGGIAGIARRWKVEPDAKDAGDWIELIDRCPWDQECPAQPGADRYVWSIRARTPAAKREQDVPESALEGPWRRLVDAVRAASGS